MNQPSRTNSNSPSNRQRSSSPPTLFSNIASGNSSNKLNVGGTSPNYRDKVKRNSIGGFLVTPEEIETAFNMLDVEKTGVITLPNLKKRLGSLFPDMSAKEYRFLMNNKKDLMLSDLKELLLDNDITNFDPVAEAFRIFDTRGDNCMENDKLRQAFHAFGFGDLTEEELEILVRTADIDGDGVISFDDFRAMTDPNARRGSVTK